MEKFQQLYLDAEQKIKNANHIINITYESVQEPKLLLSCIENLFLALTYGLGSAVHHERLFKRIPPFTDNFEGKLQVLKSHIMQKYEINEDIPKLLKEIKTIVVQHKTSPIEFQRKGAYIICNDNYDMQTLTKEIVVDYIKKTKDFLSVINTIISRDNQIFSR